MDKSYSFKKGYSQVPLAMVREVKVRIMNKLGISSNPQFTRRLRGLCAPTPAEVDAIEAIFQGVGITDIWGEEMIPNDWSGTGEA